ncbi:MAG: hypothetical protein SWO11_22370, partial [Thermodesulfobacteriota bacterium]|nr:hypothetical protein [Thermodesulfobacteriota bacterium]
MMNETWLAVKEVTNIEKISEMTFYRRFKLGHYPAHKYVSSSSGGRGGRQLLIALSSLPPSAQVQYMQSRSEGSPHAATKALLTPRVRTIMKFSTAAAWNQEIALARAELISLIGLKSGKAKKHKTKRTTLAVEAYNDHVIKADVTLPSGEMKDIYSLLGKVSVKTLYKWKKAFAQDGLDGLLTSYHGRQEVLSEELKKEIMALLFERKRNAKKIYEYLKIKFPNNELPTYETINRHVKTLRAQYAEELMYIHEGERKWKSKYQLSLGDAAGDCAEPNEKWEIDTTPADIITKEGTRWKLIALIDVYSRRVKVRLFETSNA